jgi:hypothetical protein
MRRFSTFEKRELSSWDPHAPDVLDASFDFPKGHTNCHGDAEAERLA